MVHACFDLTEAEIKASAHAVRAGGTERGTVVLRPARLSAYRQAVTGFVESRDEADWVREEDLEALALLRPLLLPLEQLCAEAMRAALSPTPRPC